MQQFKLVKSQSIFNIINFNLKISNLILNQKNIDDPDNFK